MKLYKRQHGGTFLGFVLGLVVGLGVALSVAVYVTRVPMPFFNKAQSRPNGQDAAENQKNKDWNPNGALQPKPSGAGAAMPDGANVSQPGAAAAAPAGAVPAPPAAVHTPAPAAEPTARDVHPPTPAADPLGELARARAAAQGHNETEPFHYYIQVGAFRTQAEAESQKVRVALMGLEARISEREQAGRTVYRVRLGPFDDKANAERIRTRLEGSQIESAMVRVQR